MSIPTLQQPSLHGKTVLITGAASGLGAALARRLAASGAGIFGVDLQAARLADSMAQLRELGVQAHALGVDITDPGAAQRVVAHAVDVLGRLDILVNNAGTDVTLPIAELPDADWLRVVGTNLSAPFLLSKYAAAAMRRQGGGQIVNIASTAAKRAWPNASAYHASKWGLLGLSHALHAELRSENIRVTAVIAGGMRTPFLLERFPDLDADTLQDPADVADAIHSVLVLPPTTVVAELTVLPLRETSWP
ncbi:SDR family oxidoreductase [Massilia sp. 9I]|uniref:SDR family oxidoreductase n=1 Tax=Massilia sp. 9I TaxID=2653152 RepID=UPI0012F0190D|nr:SDR family oxidoreductase [Massilia sp. 9I]VXC73393.1 Short-chain dehydrogenase/reductase 3-oxoacyl-(acyl-carrier-protein) reductase-like protein [Massilia sp. 9I]